MSRTVSKENAQMYQNVKDSIRDLKEYLEKLYKGQYYVKQLRDEPNTLEVGPPKKDSVVAKYTLVSSSEVRDGRFKEVWRITEPVSVSIHTKCSKGRTVQRSFKKTHTAQVAILRHLGDKTVLWEIVSHAADDLGRQIEEGRSV